MICRIKKKKPDIDRMTNCINTLSTHHLQHRSLWVSESRAEQPSSMTLTEITSYQRVFSFYVCKISSLWIIYLKSVLISLTFDRLNSLLLVYLLAAVFEKWGTKRLREQILDLAWQSFPIEGFAKLPQWACMLPHWQYNNSSRGLSSTSAFIIFEIQYLEFSWPS